MMLFQDEKFHVSEIKFVTNYNPEYKRVYKFPGRLPTYELMYFYIGDLHLEFANQRFYIKTGDMVYLPKGIDNDCYRITTEHPFGVYSIYFDTSDSLPNEALHMPIQNSRLKPAYEAIHRTWTAKKHGYYFKTMQTFYEILQMVANSHNNYAKQKNNLAFEKVEEYITAHFCDKDFDYERLAECSGYSYSYFKKFFIAKYGMAPNRYITERRMDYACELLGTGKYKISEIALMCGYENVYYFSNVFKKSRGVSPKKYIAE